MKHVVCIKEKISVILCAFFLSFFVPNFLQAEGVLSGKDDLYLKKYLHCSDVPIFFELKFDDPNDNKYQWIISGFDCKSEEYVTIAKLRCGQYIEIERLSSDKFVGSKMAVKRIKSNAVDLLLIIHSFDPSDIVDNEYVRVFNMRDGKIIFSVWSFNNPKIGDLNGDGAIDLVIYKNAFSIDLPGLPALPVIISLGEDIEIKDIYFYQGFLKNELNSVENAKMFWKNACKAFNGNCPDLISARVKSLTSLEKFLKQHIKDN